MLPDDKTSVLLARLADGDRRAASALFHELWPPVRRFTGALLKDASDADDAAQDAMVTIFEKAADYDRSRAALPWALAVAAFSARTIRRRRERRREEPEDDMPDMGSDTGPDAELEQRQLVAAALTALSSLADVDRETLVTTYWQERGSATGATVRKRRERALGRLRTVFGRIYGLG